jgi:hypothetical protein
MIFYLPNIKFLLTPTQIDLFKAVYRRDKEKIKECLKNEKPDPLIIFFALSNNDLDSIQMLCDVKETNFFNTEFDKLLGHIPYGLYKKYTPLSFAFKLGNVELAKTLIALGADINGCAIYAKDNEEDEDGGDRRRAKAPSFSSPEGGSSRHAPIMFGEEVFYYN